MLPEWPPVINISAIQSTPRLLISPSVSIQYLSFRILHPIFLTNLPVYLQHGLRWNYESAHGINKEGLMGEPTVHRPPVILVIFQQTEHPLRRLLGGRSSGGE
nr:hypothetical protein Iba_chr04fCG7260 [Ipomoea batatas]